MKAKIILGLCFFVILFSGCSKDEEGDGTSEGDIVTLTTEKEIYAPLEVVTIVSNESVFGENILPAKINGLDVTVQPGENTAAFLAPNLENGTYNLEFSIGDKNYQVPVKIQGITNIASPDTYYADVTGSMDSNIILLESRMQELIDAGASPAEYTAIENDIEKYTSLLEDYENQYAALDATGKADFAKFMAANKALIDEINGLSASFGASLNSLRTMQIDDYEAGVEISKAAFVQSVLITVAHIPSVLTVLNMLAVPTPWTVVGALLAGSVVVTSFVINLIRVKEMTFALINKALKPYENLTVSQAVYQSGEELGVDISAKYRSLFSGDENGEGNGIVITTIVSTFNTLKNKFNYLRNIMPEKFRPGADMQGLKSAFNSVVRSVHNKYVTITNVSNPNVSLEQINQEDGSVKIKATTTAGTDQQFTYDVVYTNGNFTADLKKTVSAEVKINCDGIPVINSAQWVCDNNKITVEVSFSAPGSGIIVGGGSGACAMEDTCYPVRLYFYYVNEWNIAANGYYVEQVSGDKYGGVLHLIVYHDCYEGMTPAESVLANYPNYQWKVELMNPCNERTSLQL